MMDGAAVTQRMRGLDAVACGDVVLLEHEPMCRHTSFRIGGPAALMAVVRRNPIASARALLVAAGEMGVHPFCMGNGSDLLVSDEGYGGLIIKTTAAEMTCHKAHITAQSGVLLSRLANFAQAHGLAGLEFAHGIPGSLGGGLTMNAGAYGGELCQVTATVTVLDRAGQEHVFDNDACGFGYRHSVFSGGAYYIAGAQLTLTHGDSAAIQAQMDALMEKRKARQPLQYPSAGSTFKRPPGHFAAALIDQCGLRGRAVGGAQVSQLHTGFIINRGGATYADVMALMAQVRDEVQRQTGVTLEPEVQIL